MKIFVTGISTDVGKTVVSAIITEALQADYWKPIQAGDLCKSDSMRVKSLLSNERSVVHPEAFRLNTPASPHLAAEIDNVSITVAAFSEPKTNNHLVIEGAGGLLVPLNDVETIADLIKPDYHVVVVSRHYLGSINHTLLTLEALKFRNLKIGGIIFSGDENQATESIILKKSAAKLIGRINSEPYFDKNVVSEYAELFKSQLNDL